jgi:hypothetical protein
MCGNEDTISSLPRSMAFMHQDDRHKLLTTKPQSSYQPSRDRSAFNPTEVYCYCYSHLVALNLVFLTDEDQPDRRRDNDDQSAEE